MKATEEATSSLINRRGFLASAGALAAAAGASAKTPLLVDNGRSGYSIVIGQQASLSEKRAAGELQRFLQEMSGARLPIVTANGPFRGRSIFVGDSTALRARKPGFAFESLEAEEYVLKMIGSDLVIAGGRQRGTMYGVYGYLDKLGCRWFTEHISRIPKTPTIRLPALNETRRPSFEYREPFFAEALAKDWAARNRQNGNRMNLDDSTGGKVQYFPFVHSFLQLVPPEKYFEHHPEYYSLTDGKRRPGIHSQLCLTNQGTLRVAVETVREWIATHPEATIYSVSQNDWTGWCECDHCRKVEEEEGGAHSGPLLRFVNALAAEIEKTHPDKLIDTLAYWYTETPPAHVRPRPNVRIRLCPIDACIAHPFEQCRHDAYFMNNLRAWSEITSQLYIWHYNTNFHHYLAPCPDFDELAADIPMYRRHGVVGIFLEGAPTAAGGAENAELRSYVMARLLWDVNTDVRRDIEDFHHACYGAAAPPMLAYFDLLHQQVRPAPAGKGAHVWIFDPVTAEYLDPEFLNKAQALLQQAAALAGNEDFRRRVHKARLSIDYVEVTQSKRFLVKNGWYAPADLSGLRSRWNALISDVRSFGMDAIHEHFLLDDDVALFDLRIRPYRVVTLENKRIAVHVVPELEGRVVSFMDKATGREILFHPDVGDRQYPNMAGLVAAPRADYVATDAWDTKWDVQPGAGENEVVLTGTSANGCQIQRTLRLIGETATLRTETTLINQGTRAIEAALMANIQVAPQDIETLALAFSKRDGSIVHRKLLAPEQRPASNGTYDSPDGPAGEWRIVDATGTKLTSRFDSQQAGRASYSWSGKGTPVVSLTVWSQKRVLNGGERIRLDVEYTAG
ncbi:MAG TPA: DUF4838 domain-containing protein [Bryobacteraceae bacterium]|nr:DUF4838 domain-containing protein [Bryobacteraceae bacterium]